MTLTNQSYYRLINFNAPRPVIKAFDELLQYKGVSRTSQILHLIDQFIKEEQRDNRLNASSADIIRQRRERLNKLNTVEQTQIDTSLTQHDRDSWEKRLLEL